MSLFSNFFSYLLLLALLFSCGFEPVYRQANFSNSSELSKIKVNASSTVKGVIFKNELDKLLNPTSSNDEAKYLLDTSFTKDKIAIAIQQDRTITRFKIIGKLNYKLTDLSNGKLLDEGVLKREAGYDRVDSDYATYVSDEDTTQRLIEELAEDARIRMISFFNKNTD